MKIITAVALTLTFLSGCASSRTADYFHPLIITNGVDMQTYEVQRSVCEAKVKANPSNFQASDLARFRQCLHEKGYRFMN